MRCNFSAVQSLVWCCAQTIVDGFQHEQPDYWLNFGNPWEIERLNVGYPVNFYGHVSVHEEEGRQVFRWNPGESVSFTPHLVRTTLVAMSDVM